MSTIEQLAKMTRLRSAPYGPFPEKSSAHPLAALWLVLMGLQERAEHRYRLAELTDDQLRDVGLTREEANRQADKPFLFL